MSTQTTKEEVNRKLFPFLRLKNETYLLDLTFEKAFELGIGKEDYDNFIKEIEATNDYIQKAKTESSYEIELLDPEKIDIERFTSEVPPSFELSDTDKIDGETLQQSVPSGTISSSGQNRVGTSFFAPVGTREVQFIVRGNAAPVPVFICRTHAFTVTNTRTKTGIMFTWTIINVPVAASNITVNIDFQTTDSNGGICRWKAIIV